MDIVKTGRFIAGLSLKGWLSILGATIMFMVGVYIYDQRATIDKLQKQNQDKDVVIQGLTDRYNINVANLRMEVENCNKMRIEDQKESNEYWRERVENLEERAAKNYREIKQKQ